MKTAGVVRHVDHLGRIVVPIEVRRTFEIESFSDIEILVDGDSVVLKKFVPSCTLCHKPENTFTYRDKIVCRDCAQELEEQLSQAEGI